MRQKVKGKKKELANISQRNKRKLYHRRYSCWGAVEQYYSIK